MIELEATLKALIGGDVEFIIVGGTAATLHGSVRLTLDLDVVYSRSPNNLDRIVEALKPFRPSLRGAPQGLPFLWDARTLRSGLNFTLQTELGDIDLLGEMSGGGSYEELMPDAVTVELFGMRCTSLSLEQLMRAKRAAGRRKDLDALAELEALRDEKERN